MEDSESGRVEKALGPQPGRMRLEAVVPNPKLKLLDQLREALRLKHYSIRSERTSNIER
jgi:hypothetical protein